MKFERSAGVLMHPTSLPGPYGIGDLGASARQFVDALVEMGQHIWQVLPLGPTGYGDSPYQALSSFAGNPILISFEELVEDGLLDRRHLAGLKVLGEGSVSYGEVIPAKMAVLQTVCRTFSRRASESLKSDFETYCRRERGWLDDYALFVALKQAHGGKQWIGWPKELAQREAGALGRARREHATAIRDVKIQQFLFERQWHALRVYCHRRRIKIVGDLPIFVAHDGADVWSHQELFKLDKRGHLEVQAGVPPDYFSKTGQLWGNPIYRWDVHAETGYAWWVARMRRTMELFDIVRLDHFRGFEAHWEVPGKDKTAENGKWVKGAGYDLFKHLRQNLGETPMIVEDLGDIDDDVRALKKKLGYPGMLILQFEFGTDPHADCYKAKHYVPNSVVYTGTHDNAPVLGWLHCGEKEYSTSVGSHVESLRKAIHAAVKPTGSGVHWDLIRFALNAKSNTCVVQLQDILGLGDESRMNMPGTCGGNWQWRFRWEMLTDDMKRHMREITEKAGR